MLFIQHSVPVALEKVRGRKEVFVVMKTASREKEDPCDESTVSGLRLRF